MDPLIDVAALVVAEHGDGSGDDLDQRMDVGDLGIVTHLFDIWDLRRSELFWCGHAQPIHPQAGTDDRFHHLEIGCENPGLPSPVFNAEPVVRRGAGAGVVVVLQIVGTTHNPDHLVLVRVLKGHQNGLLGRVVGLGFQQEISLGNRGNRGDGYPDRKLAHLGGSNRQRGGPLGQTGVAPDLAQGLGAVCHGFQVEVVGASRGGPVDQMQVRVQRMQRLLPPGRSFGVEVSSLPIESQIRKIGSPPTYLDAGIGRKRGGFGDAHRHLKDLVPLELPLTLPTAFENNPLLEVERSVPSQLRSSQADRHESTGWQQ